MNSLIKIMNPKNSLLDLKITAKVNSINKTVKNKQKKKEEIFLNFILKSLRVLRD